LGEALSTPLLGLPLMGANQTFISLGCFDTANEANNLLIYLKTKFSRVMLGVSKVTQTASGADLWQNVPVQDFSPQSDIDWTQPIPEIDKQLFAKYKLTQEQIDYINTKVAEMK